MLHIYRQQATTHMAPFYHPITHYHTRQHANLHRSSSAPAILPTTAKLLQPPLEPNPAVTVQQAHLPTARAPRIAAPAPAACTPAAPVLPAARHAQPAHMPRSPRPAFACVAHPARIAAAAPANASSASLAHSPLAMHRYASAAHQDRTQMLVQSAARCARLGRSPTEIGAAAAHLARILHVERMSALSASRGRLLAGTQIAACPARLATLRRLRLGSVSSARLARTQVSMTTLGQAAIVLHCGMISFSSDALAFQASKCKMCCMPASIIPASSRQLQLTGTTKRHLSLLACAVLLQDLRARSATVVHQALTQGLAPVHA
jgi:hypothetical protein